MWHWSYGGRDQAYIANQPLVTNSDSYIPWKSHVEQKIQTQLKSVVHLYSVDFHRSTEGHSFSYENCLLFIRWDSSSTP